ncbi:MAG: hypothetical protein A2X86_14725 [Bdellovibrionales bacterium GWA2_49_15]|nr:MAG: hypothetical protein A2X86_14725 [Bdellovibrionales bacterium GWA2_49_15]HAZ13405.1 hypothetical protein [Bdellovibrionales bacterium]
MKIFIFSFLILVLSAANKMALAQTTEGPTDYVRCPFEISALDPDTQRMIEELRSRIPLTAGPDDIALDNGSVLDQSCFTGELSGRRAELTRILRESVEQAQIRLRQCARNFGLWEPSEASDALDRTRINCFVAGSPLTAGAMDRVNRCSVGDPRFSARAVGRYSLSMAVFPETPTNPKDQTIFTASVDENASFIAHEAMHVLAANNTSWHNDPRTHSSTGCANSIFEDRIYFLQAVCFPDSNYGRLMRDPTDGILNCPQVCQNALTHVDAATIEIFTPVERPDATGIFGPSLVAIPYGRDRAPGICQRIRDDAL